jgi:hypothetical protein
MDLIVNQIISRAYNVSTTNTQSPAGAVGVANYSPNFIKGEGVNINYELRVTDWIPAYAGMTDMRGRMPLQLRGAQHWNATLQRTSARHVPTIRQVSYGKNF